MLSYEDIFLRHHPRPLSYLNSYLDSPVTRIPTPVVLRSPALYKERRRPTSIACLDDTISRIINDSYKRASKDPVSRSSCDNLCLFSRDIAPRTRPRGISKDIISEILNDCPKPPLKNNAPKVLRENYRIPSKPGKSRDFVDNYRHALTFPGHLSRRELPLCTPDDLLDIIREPTGYYALPTDPWNEVYPGIYLSDAPTALCTSVLKSLGITHVLNAAQGREKNCGQVNTTSGFYSQSGIQFLGVPAFDNIVFRIYPYFEEAAQFIEDGLKSKGKVLVHCRAGISRSATLVCAFLMMKRGLSVQEAVRTVRKNRAIIPNDGFLQQLCDLNDRLKQKNKF